MLAAFMMMNRNKRGVAVDLKQEGGKELLRRLPRAPTYELPQGHDGKSWVCYALRLPIRG
jgi:hypothetical protein